MALFGLEYPAPYISFLFIFLGMLLRTLFPYIQKLRETPEGTTLKWDHKYTLTIFSNLILSFIATVLFFSNWSPPEGTLFQVAIASFIAGWGSQDILNYLV